MMKRSLMIFCGLVFAVSVVLSLVNNPVLAQNNVYTAFSVSGEGSPVPWKTEARLTQSDTGPLWGDGGAGLTNFMAIVGGNQQQVMFGGVYVRYAADGFWSNWGYIPYILQGADNWTFTVNRNNVRSVGALAHYNLTRITVTNAGIGWNKLVDVRTGINGYASSIMVSDLPTAMKTVKSSPTSSGYIDYRIPNVNCYVTTEKDSWTYIAPFQGAGVPITLDMKTGSQLVKVKKGGLPLTNANVYAVHEAYFNQSALPINNYIANTTPMVTPTSGIVYPKAQIGMTIRYIASEQNSNDFYKATSAVTVSSNGSASNAKVIIPVPSTPALVSPSNNELIDYYDTVDFSWGATPNAVSYKIFILDLETGASLFEDVGNVQAVSTYLDEGYYGWYIVPIDSEGDPIATSTARFFDVGAP
jgi:hypothetical protein